ncbi:protein disulfide-isomerase A2 [Phascolarctos cinereus]|uniref:Protein disulfide-isomerase A2 n=1 Tax=Phascolarctos cinereus TaxID=38626 RepID=A0A6P5LYS2_PHACI|nr:protein disulfide-isomerase A2 [Phascolarctos cinereus]
MRLHSFLLLFLLTAWAWGLDGEEGVEEEEEEEEAKAPEEASPGPPSDELLEEDNILVLTQHNFARALREHRYLLVEFYAPWCKHCKALAPEYAKAASLLKNESSELKLAKVDGPAEMKLVVEFGVTGYPVFKFFQDGNRSQPVEFTGPQEAESIVRWLKRRLGPAATQLETEAEARQLIDSQDLVVIGFFKDLQDEDMAVFLAIAKDAVDMTFGFTDRPELFQKYGVSQDTVVLFKKFDEGRADYPVDEELGLTQADLSHFLVVHSMHLVMEFNRQTSSKIFGARILNHLVLFINQTLTPHKELLTGFQEAAPPFRGEVLFVVVDVAGENDHVLQYFGMNATEAPTLRFINIDTTKKYLPTTEEITAASVTTFCQDVLSGKVKPQLRSQAIPPDWDQKPVKVLVGKNFEQVAFDESKNVFVKFYAPWCTHCKEMAQTWEDLAEKYKDHEDIIIAELDSTANELEAFTVRGFPTLKYFPAGPGRKVIEYKSARDLETFSKFLDNGGVLPEPEKSEVPIPEAGANNSKEHKDEL